MALTATVSPSDATETSVAWSSSDETIASVSNGTVTGVSAGTATITATALDGSGVTGTYTVTVETRTETVYAEGQYNFASDYTTLAAYTLAGKGFEIQGGISQLWLGYKKWSYLDIESFWKLHSYIHRFYIFCWQCNCICFRRRRNCNT